VHGIGEAPGETLGERLRSLGRREILGLVVLVTAVIAGAALWYVRSLPSQIHIETTGPYAGDGPAASTTSSAPPAPATIVVYVSGLVRHPGVYEFQEGQRIVDAVARAGGARRGADLTTLNLAALLVDGEQIIVGAAGAPGASSGTIVGSGSGGDGAGPVNLNTATLDQLETLPGIGPALGQRIIDYREEHGPFQSVDDLLNVSGIGEKRLEDLRSGVTV